MIVEIEYFEGDALLYGKNVRMSDLKFQFSVIENSYDREMDNFVELFCRWFGWTVLDTEEIPDFTYDRDIKRLYRRRSAGAGFCS